MGLRLWGNQGIRLNGLGIKLILSSFYSFFMGPFTIILFGNYAFITHFTLIILHVYYRLTIWSLRWIDCVLRLSSKIIYPIFIWTIPLYQTWVTLNRCGFYNLVSCELLCFQFHPTAYLAIRFTLIQKGLTPSLAIIFTLSL